MSTLTIRAAQMPKVQPLPGLAHLVAVILAVIDAYSDALRLTHEVQQKYPFIDV